MTLDSTDGNVDTGEIPKTSLIIVPWDLTMAYAYGIECSMTRRHTGNNVFYLDLSKFNDSFTASRLRTFIRRIKLKNSPKYLSSSILKNEGINVLHSPELKTFQDFDFHREHIYWTAFETALRSQFAYWHGNSSIEIRDLPPKLFKGAKVAFVNTYNLVRDLIRDLNIDEIVTINGRFVIDGAIICAAISSEIEYTLIETVDSPIFKKYVEFKVSPHSNSELLQVMQTNWALALKESATEAKAIAKDRLKLRLSNDWSWRSKLTLEDERFNSNHIVFFPSSDIEFSFLSISENRKHWSQVEAFQSLVRTSKAIGKRVVVRVHPKKENSNSISFDDSFWAFHCKENDAILIDSNNPTDSLHLAKTCYLSVVYWSSIGAEIAALGLPIAITGDALYGHLIPECRVSGEEELVNFLVSPVVCSDSDQVLPYFYFEAEGGRSFQFLNVERYGEVKFGNLNLSETTWLYKFYNLSKIAAKLRRLKTSKKSEAPWSLV